MKDLALQVLDGILARAGLARARDLEALHDGIVITVAEFRAELVEVRRDLHDARVGLDEFMLEPPKETRRA